MSEKKLELEQTKKETDAREPEIGDIVYYGHWGDICMGIFCGHPIEKQRSIVFQLIPKPIIKEMTSPAGCKLDFFACTTERNEDIFLAPEDLIEHELAAVRVRMERQIEALKKPVA